jgi:ribonuclease P protein subunit RPR2
MSRRSGRAKAKRLRQEKALDAQIHLSGLISNPSNTMELRKNAARHLVKTSRRHRLPLPVQQRHWICRGCTTPLIPGTTSRTRIREGQRITTCLECGRIRRFGGGPGYHRRSRIE